MSVTHWVLRRMCRCKTSLSLRHHCSSSIPAGGIESFRLEQEIPCLRRGYFQKEEEPKRSTYTTLEFKPNITRAIPLGMLVEAIGTIQHSGRSTGVANGEIRGVEDGRLYATGSTTCLIMKLR